jgi:rSAM/selenodomain-associated transferase 1
VSATSRPPRERLAVFARYPAPGLVKTRLIPALGPRGAADLHAAMTRRTLELAASWAERRRAAAELWISGAGPDEVERPFGRGLPLREQQGADLGERMSRAFEALLAEADAAVIVGTDCPELSAAHLDQAFDALLRSDVVLGPALDGGYYLIGLRRPAPLLFDAIEWGTPSVRRATHERARAAGLELIELLPLRDVDGPDDLAVWTRALEQDRSR